MVLVVDASAAVKWLVPEEGSDLALGLHDSTQEMHAPRLLAAEVTNALWRKARVGELDQAEASALAAEVPRLPVQWHTDETNSLPSEAACELIQSVLGRVSGQGCATDPEQSPPTEVAESD
ncbi:MAG: type II toxin-antitoxin system VapC family toxin [Gammaproteobacteria bacterium]|nr:type II toxin-antitoxin system VapC family toxin [Gammaproteobacteria bacterium]